MRPLVSHRLWPTTRALSVSDFLKRELGCDLRRRHAAADLNGGVAVTEIVRVPVSDSRGTQARAIGVLPNVGGEADEYATLGGAILAGPSLRPPGRRKRRPPGSRSTPPPRCRSARGALGTAAKLDGSRRSTICRSPARSRRGCTFVTAGTRDECLSRIHWTTLYTSVVTDQATWRGRDAGRGAHLREVRLPLTALDAQRPRAPSSKGILTCRECRFTDSPTVEQVAAARRWWLAGFSLRSCTPGRR